MFITSVIMVVVLAIALTTSSLAWFTAGGTQTVSTAAVNISTKANSAVAGLEISANNSLWYSQNPDGGLTLTTRTGKVVANLDPAAPVSTDGNAPTGGNSLDASAKAAQGLMLYNAILNSKTNDTVRVNGVSGPELQFEGDSGSANYYASDVYLRNSGAAACTVDIDITLTANTSDQASPAVFWYAIFDLTEENNVVTGATLLALDQVGYEAKTNILFALAGTELDSPALVSAVHTLAVGTGSIVEQITGALTLDAATTLMDGSVTPSAAHHLALLAWYDGRFLVNENSNTSVSAAIEFSVHGSNS